MGVAKYYVIAQTVVLIIDVQCHDRSTSPGHDMSRKFDMEDYNVVYACTVLFIPCS